LDTRSLTRAATLWTLVISATALAQQAGPDDVVAVRARDVHGRAIVVDTHDDTTQRWLSDPAFDLGASHSTGNIDIPRMRQGGLDALFFSIYMPGDVTGPLAVKRALQQIDKVREAVRAHPRELLLATSAADIRRAVAERKIAALMGMEGGHMIDASHSSCRAISNSPRNMSDDMLRALARNGGVIMINYHLDFISEAFRTAKPPAAVQAQLDGAAKQCGKDEACLILDWSRIYHEAMNNRQMPIVGWTEIVDHIEHVVKVAGIDHVGLGSDFDGAIMPLGMEDASKLPKITGELLRRGYSERDVTKILGGNVLRVMEQAGLERRR